MVRAAPAQVKYLYARDSTHLHLMKTPHLFHYSETFDWRNRQPYIFSQGSNWLATTLTAPSQRWTTPTHAAPRVPFLQRRITNPLSDQTPVPGLALHAHPLGTSTDNPLLLLLDLPSGQTQARGLPLLLLEQSAAVHSPPPVVSVRERLPVQLSARRHAPVSVAPSPAL